MENSDLLASRPIFDANKIAPGAVIRVWSKILPCVRNSYEWNALVIRVEPFEILVAKLPPEQRGAYEDDDVETQRLHIDSVVNGDTHIELLRKP